LEQRRTARIECRGHANIKATHAKTIELFLDDDIGSAATCGIGVGASYDENALLALRGAVKIVFRSGDAEDIVTARVNPTFRRGDPLIIRRFPRPQPNTFCFAASKGSAALDRKLVESLRRPGATLEVRFEEVGVKDDLPAGALYLVGMPIGNPMDLSLRALDTLSSVDLVLCEDTRVAMAELSHHGLRPKLQSYHGHNEDARVGDVIGMLQDGARIALISDAGMPVISDPGLGLVKAAQEAGIAVTVVPGPDSVIASIAMCGLDASDFRFIGFMPRKSGARRKHLADSDGDYAIVFLESTHRISETLEDVAAVWPERIIAVCRDLTKPKERIFRGTASAVLQEIADDELSGGEFTVVVERPRKFAEQTAHAYGENDVRFVKALVDNGCPTKVVAAALSDVFGGSRNAAFQFVLQVKGERPE
jgi:16S rRNA (cytidine1402-2'-O)-methyltransferase